MKNKTYIFTVIKLIDFVFILTVYFIIAFIVSLFLQAILKMILPNQSNPLETNKQSQQEQQSQQRQRKPLNLFFVFVEILVSITLIVVVSYFFRNIVQKIPFPLDGIEGFDHKKVKELQGGILTTFLFLFNNQIFTKAKELFAEVNTPFQSNIIQ